MWTLSLMALAVGVTEEGLSRYDPVCRAPAEEWLEGLPLGNGDLGVIAYGRPEELSFALNQTDVWDYRYEDVDDRPEFTFANVSDAIARGDAARYRALVDPHERWYNEHPYPMPVPCGRLQVRLGRGYDRYEQALRLYRATLEGRYGHPHGDVSLDAFVHATRPLLWLRLRGLPTGQPVILSLNRGGLTKSCFGPAPPPDPDVPHLTFEGQPGQAQLVGDFPDGLRYVIALRVVGADATFLPSPGLPGEAAAAGVRSEGESLLQLDPSARDVDLLLSVAPDPAQADRVLDEAAQIGWEALRAEHEAWWREFWGKSSVHLPVWYLEQQWNMGLYVLASTYRAGHLCPALFGLWCYDETPAWHGDYHLDRNVQLPFWGMYASNHLELTEPFYAFYETIRPQVRKETRRFYGWDGLLYGGTLDPRGRNLGGWMPCTLWEGSSAWIAEHFWWGWRYSMDEAFLRDRAYPLMRECVDFYERYLQRRPDGRYFLFPSHCPETGANDLLAWGTNSTASVALIKKLFEWTLQTSEWLGEDEERRPLWREILAHFPDYPVQGGHIVDFEEYPDRTLSFTDGMRITPMWPAGDLGLDSPPEVLELGRRTLRSASGWATMMAGAAARLGLGEEAFAQLQYLERLVGASGVGVGGGWDGVARRYESPLRRIFPEHHGGVVGALNEMLLQSHGRALRVFPAVPAAWGEISFERLRAEGAFLVSAERRAGTVAEVRLESEAGRPVALVNPWVEAAWTVEDTAPGEILARGDGPLITFETKPGHTYRVKRET